MHGDDSLGRVRVVMRSGAVLEAMAAELADGGGGGMVLYLVCSICGSRGHWKWLLGTGGSGTNLLSIHSGLDRAEGGNW